MLAFTAGYGRWPSLMNGKLSEMSMTQGLPRR